MRWVCDLDEYKLETIRRRYMSVRTTTHLEEVLVDREVDAVAIAIPVHNASQARSGCAASP